MSATRRIAYFVSPHGYGHATRAAAVIDALQTLDSGIEIEVVTTAPRRLFDDSLANPIFYLECVSDVGLVQESPLKENLSETLRLLDNFLPFDGTTVHSLAERLKDRHCELVVCDIAPLGIVVARAAGVPSLLIENFTWDWIYGAYVESAPDFIRHITYLEPLFDAADYHIRAEPACESRACDLTVKPIGRKGRQPAAEVRAALGVTRHAKMVLVTMGGTPTEWYPEGELSRYPDVQYVVPTKGDSLEVRDNVVRLPALSGFYYPDLVSAADVVIAKLGYSTVAEAYYMGVPLGFIPRPSFRETSVLERFVRDRMQALVIGVDAFERDGWASQLSRLLGLPRTNRDGIDGAREAAEFICKIAS